jgi:hypothetical protein
MALKRANSIEGGKKMTRVSEEEVQSRKLVRTDSVEALDSVPSNGFAETRERAKTLIFIFNSVLFKYCTCSMYFVRKVRRILKRCKIPKLFLKVSRNGKFIHSTK